MAEREKGPRTLQNRPFTYQKSATHTWQVTKVGELIDSPNENGKDWPPEVSPRAQCARSERC